MVKLHNQTTTVPNILEAMSNLTDADLSAFANDSLPGNATAPHKKASEGGVFSGNSPLQSDLALFLIQAIIIISLSRFIHLFLRKLRQPRVIAEVIGGICLGPSVLGNLPGFTDTIFRSTSLSFLSLISNVGLVLYLFLVGLELDPKAFFGDLKRSLTISAAGIVLPFLLGTAVSYGMYHVLMDKTAPDLPVFPSFLLFTGVAMSITAFPVLARILTELKLLSTPVGLMTITAAAVDDATAWTLLALVVSILNAGQNVTAVYVFLTAFAYALVLLIVFRLLFQISYDRFFKKSSEAVTQLLMATIFIFIFISAWLTEIIGVHAIFGAFLMGLCIPRNSDLPMQLTEKIEDVVNIVFLPLFFASSGLKTRLSLLNDGVTWGFLILVIVVACSGKIFGCTLSARAVGIPWRDSWTIGFLMNTKGLVELIVLNIGLDAKVINAKIFAIMVVMALVTTFMTSPIVSFLYPPKYYNRQLASRSGKRSLPNLGEAAVEDYVNLRCLLYIENLDSIPLLATFMRLLQKAYEKTKLLALTALKMVETSERSSAVMIAAQSQAAIQADTTLKMVDFFGRFLGVDINCFLMASPVGEFAEEVNQVCGNENCNLVLVPYTDKSSEQTVDVVRKSKVTTVVVCNHSDTLPLAVQSATQQHPPLHTSLSTTGKVKSDAAILVPFIGGANDREALLLAMRFYHNNCVTTTILSVKPVQFGKSLKKQKSNGETDIDLAYFVQHDAVDIALLKHVQHLVKANHEGTLMFREVEAHDVAGLVANECATTKYDFILFGHNVAGFMDAAFAETPESEVANGNTGSLEKQGRFHRFSETSIGNDRKASTAPAIEVPDVSRRRSSLFKRRTSLMLKSSSAFTSRLMLGKLGSSLYDLPIEPTLLIVHKPKGEAI